MSKKASPCALSLFDKYQALDLETVYLVNSALRRTVGKVPQALYNFLRAVKECLRDGHCVNVEELAKRIRQKQTPGYSGRSGGWRYVGDFWRLCEQLGLITGTPIRGKRHRRIESIARIEFTELGTHLLSCSATERLSGEDVRAFPEVREAYLRVYANYLPFVVAIEVLGAQEGWIRSDELLKELRFSRDYYLSPKFNKNILEGLILQPASKLGIVRFTKRQARKGTYYAEFVNLAERIHRCKGQLSKRLEGAIRKLREGGNVPTILSLQTFEPIDEGDVLATVLQALETAKRRKIGLGPPLVVLNAISRRPDGYSFEFFIAYLLKRFFEFIKVLPRVDIDQAQLCKKCQELEVVECDSTKCADIDVVGVREDGTCRLVQCKAHAKLQRPKVKTDLREFQTLLRLITSNTQMQRFVLDLIAYRIAQYKRTKPMLTGMAPRHLFASNVDLSMAKPVKAIELLGKGEILKHMNALLEGESDHDDRDAFEEPDRHDSTRKTLISYDLKLFPQTMLRRDQFVVRKGQQFLVFLSTEARRILRETEGIMFSSELDEAFRSWAFVSDVTSHMRPHPNPLVWFESKWRLLVT